MSSGLTIDPSKLANYIHQVVKVRGSSGHCHQGRVVAIDPVSSSVVLIKRVERGESLKDTELVLIPWIDLDSLLVVNNPTLLDEDRRLRQKLLEKQSHSSFEIPKNSRTKEEVIGLLQKHQIEVTPLEKSADILSICGGVAILKPPYLHCETSNVIVLDRISSILKLGD